jgi:class 3 adenylate cyclase
MVVPQRVERMTSAPGRVLRNISVASRLALVVVLVALVSVVVTAVVGLDRGRTLAKTEIDNQLTAIGAARADQVERYISGLERAVVGQALTPRPAAVIAEFSARFAELDASPPSSRDVDLVEAYYRDVVAPDLTEARGRPVNPTSLVPVSNAGITLQAQYVVPTEDGNARRTGYDEWTELHDPLDDSLSEFALQQGFDDVYLIEPVAQVVVYSTQKNIDFATSLRAGPHSGSQLASLTYELAEDPSPGDVAIRDFAAYAPAGEFPSAFVGSPVFADGELAGFVVGRFTPAEITAIMTNDEQWGALGDTGETYVVAADARMRSDSRLFLQDRAAFFAEVEAASSATADEIDSMQRFDTTVLYQPIDLRQVDAAFEGSAGVETVTNYLGREVASTTELLDIDGLEWSVFSQADLAEIEAPIDDFTRNLLVAIAVFIVVVTFIAVRWADRLLEPLRIISMRLRAIRDGGDDAELTDLPDSSAAEFVELGDDIDTMLATLRRRTTAARRRADERRRVLRRLLPTSIAERVEAGDRDVVEQIASATVAVVVIGGLGALVSEGSTDRARQLLDRFVDDADDLAAERGLDRVQLTGDAYVAACGVSRPHLDHTARAAAFVLDVSEALRDLDAGAELFVQAGIAVGPITVGLTGGHRLIHDTWGSTIQRATDLARSARPGQVLVSDDVVSLLPSSYRFEPTGYDGVSALSALTAVAERNEVST